MAIAIISVDLHRDWHVTSFPIVWVKKAKKNIKIVSTRHLVSKQEDGLKAELPRAEIKEVLKARTE